jgi:hypothetical protein
MDYETTLKVESILDLNKKILQAVAECVETNGTNDPGVEAVIIAGIAMAIEKISSVNPLISLAICELVLKNEKIKH